MTRPTLITITGQFLKVDGTPDVGMLIFQSPVLAMYSLESRAVVPSKTSVALDSTGSFTIEVPATNDPAWIPQGWRYILTLRTTEDYAIYEVSVPYDAAGHQMSLAQLIPVDPNQPVNPANYAPLVHVHAASDIVSGTINIARLPVGTTHSTVSYGDHTHPGIGDITIDDVDGLQAALDGKAATVHSHAIADVTNLQTALNAKAATADLKTVAFSGSYNDLTDKPSSGVVSSVAGRTGDVVLTKSDVGLSNVDNTSDASKPVSTATQTALNLKANTSSLATVATTGSYTDLINKPTIPVTSVAGRTGDITLTKSDVGLGNVDNTSDASKPVSTATQTALDLKANLSSPTFTGTVSGITKSMVGLSNVDNTSDATKDSATATLSNKTLASPAFTGAPTGLTKAHVGLANVDNTSDTAKPISTATQTALDAKADSSTVTTLASRVTAVEDMTPVILAWNGSSYVESSTARLYVGPNDPGSVPDGSVWIDTDA